MKESPLIHSSENRPPSRNRLSAPLVADVNRASAPRRTALAPASDCTSAGLMMSGSWISSTSLGAQLLAIRANSAIVIWPASVMRSPRIRLLVVEGFMVVILEAEVQTERQVGRRSKRLERRWRVAGRTKRFGIDTAVL